MANNTPFNTFEYDLGSSDIGMDKLGVDEMFLSISYQPQCVICGQTPKYKLIPKHKHVDTAFIQDKGYVCEHCLGIGHVSPQDYKLKKL